MKPFYEIQRFDQWWVRLLLFIVLLITLIPISNRLYQNGLNSNFTLIEIGIPLLVLLSIYFLFMLKLETSLDAKGIHYRFFPLIYNRKTIPWKDISQCYVRTYGPLREYGGWGIRYGLNGKAYNVKGNKGIQLVLKSGKKILFGTQKENEAKNVIATYFNQKTI